MRHYLFLAFWILLSTPLAAQTPQAFVYQFTLRDAGGVQLINQSIDVELSVITDTLTGTPLYIESHSTTTDDWGQVTTQVGRGQLVSGTFNSIDWKANSHYLLIKVSQPGGSIISADTVEILTVPYALHAGNAQTVEIEQQTLSKNGDTLFISGGNNIILPTPPPVIDTGGIHTIVFSGKITDAQAAQKFQDEFGPNTEVIKVIHTNQLNILSLPGVTHLSQLRVENNSNLNTITLPNLVNVFGNLDLLNNGALTSFQVPLLEHVAEAVTIEGNGMLSTLNLPQLKITYDLQVNGNGSLQLFEANNLEEVRNDLDFTFCPLPGLSLPKLEVVHFFRLRTTNTSALNLPALVYLGDMNISFCDSLSIIDLPLLREASAPRGFTTIQIRFNSGLTYINMPALFTFHQLFIGNNNSLQGVDLSGLEEINFGFLDISNNPSLTTIDMSSLVKIVQVGFDFRFYARRNALSVSTVNHLLSKLVNLTPTPTTLDIQLHMQTPPAPPSGQGIIDRNTLDTNGNTVFTD